MSSPETKNETSSRKGQDLIKVCQSFSQKRTESYDTLRTAAGHFAISAAAQPRNGGRNRPPRLCQRGLGTAGFGIYGRDVKADTDTTIPSDVAEKILRFARAAIAVGSMRGKSYLSMGSVSMGIAGSIVNTEFFEDYLNMRCESVDMCEIIRRVNEGIYDKDEFEKALAWTKKNCKQNIDIYNGDAGNSQAKQDEIWEYVVKMIISWMNSYLVHFMIRL